MGNSMSKGLYDPPQKPPFVTPQLPPAIYGRFPQSFSLFFEKEGYKKRRAAYYLAIDHGVPLFAISCYRGWSKHKMTLYSMADRHAPPLAMAGLEGRFDTLSIIALPAADGNSGGNRLERLHPDKVPKQSFDQRNFTCLVGPPGAQHEGTFEWQKVTNKEMARGCSMRNLNRKHAAGEETVATYLDYGMPNKGSPLAGTFQFHGSGASGELGDYWALMAVMTLLKIVEDSWAMIIATDNLANAAGGLCSCGLGMCLA